MITQREVSQLAYKTQMSDRVIEKDYVLTWLRVLRELRRGLRAHGLLQMNRED